MTWFDQLADGLGTDAEEEPFVRPGLQGLSETRREREGEALGIPPQDIPRGQEVFKGSGVETEPMINVPIPNTDPPSRGDRLKAAIIIIVILLIVLITSIFGDPELHNFVFAFGSIMALIFITISLFAIRYLSTMVASILIIYLLVNMLSASAFHVGYGLRVFLAGIILALTVTLFYQTKSIIMLPPLIWWTGWFYYIIRTVDIDLFLIGGPN